ncbi:acetyltransferase [Vibrio cholerae]|nr:acetyltransferase [Vibrio cholerae]EJL6275369.1 acetyltransferase [Vibrio cholerae]EJL6998651.1 acetyltransferase [Vibrio cholerae]EKF9882660.1 acetyltransferase [Vibrio cholerae]
MQLLCLSLVVMRCQPLRRALNGRGQDEEYRTI